MSTKNICNVCGENCLYDTGEEIFGNSVYVAQKASINGLWKNENADYREDLALFARLVITLLKTI